MSPEELEKAQAAINSLLAEGWDNDAATVRELVAEIERLRLAYDTLRTSFLELNVLSGKKNIRIREQAARIQELEELNAALMKNEASLRTAAAKYRKRAQAAEAKIGTADECPDDLPPIGSPYHQLREGLYGKYRIAKVDGSPVDPNADYFVLRLDADPVAWSAAREYARMTPNRKLSNDLLERVAKYDPCDSIREPDAPRSWQITDERRRALSEAMTFLPEEYGGDTARIRNVLRAMLQEAGQ